MLNVNVLEIPTKRVGNRERGTKGLERQLKEMAKIIEDQKLFELDSTNKEVKLRCIELGHRSAKKQEKIPAKSFS